MALRQEQHYIKGMQRDLSVSKFNPEFAFDAQNIRITAREGNTLLTVTNEKGNLELPIQQVKESNKASVNSEGVITLQYPAASKLNADIITNGGSKIYSGTIEEGNAINETYKGQISEPINGVRVNVFGTGDTYDYKYQYYSDYQPIRPVSLTIQGTLIGYSTLNNYVTLFTTGDMDRIYRLENKGTYFEGRLLYEGSLNFNTNNPIEAISVYENDDIQKVYWIDGINQSRVINIVSDATYNDYSFDFVPIIDDNSNCDIIKSNTGGNFASGVIQYCATYYNRYRQETNIFYTSPLYYLSEALGSSPEDGVRCSFNINFANLNPNFDYLRLYSIQRTSIDATPTVRIVADLAIGLNQSYSKGQSLGQFTNPVLSDTGIDDIYVFNTTTNVKTPLSSYEVSRTWTDSDGNTYYYRSVYVRDTTYIYNGFNFFDREGEYSLVGTVEIVTPQGNRSCRIENASQVTKSEVVVSDNAEISYTDTGVTGETIDPTILLYVGGEGLIAGTFTQKDNTLFLGNCELQRDIVSDTLIGAIKLVGINVNYEDVIIYDINGNDINNSNYYYNGQLNNSRNDITHLMKGETYRIGVILKHKTGKYSEVIYLQDFVMNKGIENTSTENIFKVRIPRPSFFITENLRTLMRAEGFTHIKPVIVYPSINDRTVLCQGIVCPTVANLKERANGSPFAQSSWFARPIPPDSSWDTIGYEKGEVAAFQHQQILRTTDRGAEILAMETTINSSLLNYSGIGDINDHLNMNTATYFVDSNIITFHSPDIEFDDKTSIALKNGKYNFRITGYVELSATTTDIDIQTSTPNMVGTDLGLYSINIGTTNLSKDGHRGLLTEPLWMAHGMKKDGTIIDGGVFGFMVYPWHRAGSLINMDYTTEGQNWLPANLEKKKMSNLRYSFRTSYLDTSWEAFIQDDVYKTGITAVSIFDSDEQDLIKISAAENSDIGEMSYYGNVDTVITSPRGIEPLTGENIKGYSPTVASNTILPPNDSYYTIFKSPYVNRISSLVSSTSDLTDNHIYGTKPIPMKYKSTRHAVFAFNFTKFKQDRCLPVHREDLKINSPFTIDNFPLWIKAGQNGYTTEGRTLVKYNQNTTPTGASEGDLWWNPTTKYLYRYTSGGFQGISVSSTETYYTGPQVFDPIYDSSVSRYVLQEHYFIIQDVIPKNMEYGYLWLGELYRAEVPNRFGGTTEEAILNNSWNVCGEDTPLAASEVVYRGGDTYYQRYDNLKTYPYTLEDVNSVTDIVSFMCETRVNIDGRYDRNRGQKNNLVMTPVNFNLLNNVYSQEDNFFNYRTIDRVRFSINKFPNMITWSQEKIIGDIIDKWTNITVASTLDLDGDKGDVVSLNTYNNEIFCFQRRGLSNILFNSRVQIPTSDGMPIEITNGLKVSGKRYISNTIGCTNKWSIVESPSGLYFIDNETNSLYLFNGKITSLSDSLGFRQWISSHNTHENWDPVNYNNYRSFYDKNNNDVYFTYKDHCLCYSELLNQFTSFMSYEKVPAMFNISSEFYAFKDNKVWGQFQGDYNMFFGEYRPFSITMVANAEEPKDKIFNTVEFRADSWNGDTLLNNTTFDTLDVYNEYQHGTATLKNIIGHPSPLKKKFRIWRANVPRDKVNNRDRIRNTWAYIKLGMNTPNTYRTEFHDAIIHYFA